MYLVQSISLPFPARVLRSCGCVSVCARVCLYMNVILIVFYRKSEGNDTSSSSYHYHNPSMITTTTNRTKQKLGLTAHTTSMTERYSLPCGNMNIRSTRINISLVLSVTFYWDGVVGMQAV